MFLDTDQNPATGDPAEYWYGLPTQDVGMEYVVDLFGLSEAQPVVRIVDVSTYDIVAEVPATIDGHDARFDLPLSALGGDDGFINTAVIVGDQMAPTDWAPDSGHGTITPFVDVPWLSETPSEGAVAVGDHQAISVTFGGAALAPGDYHAMVVLQTDAPKQQTISIPVDLTVTLPVAFGALTGTVTDAHSGLPIAGATVSVAATWQGSALALSSVTGADGAYSIVGPEGTWSQTITLDGYVPLTRDVAIVRAVTTSGVDAAIHKDQPHASTTPDALSFVLTPGRTGTATITIANAGGHEPLTFTLNEVNLSGVAGTPAGPAAKPTVVNPAAKTAKGVWPASTWTAPPSVKSTGDVLASWPTGLSIPWGVGYTGDVVLSDPQDVIDATYTAAGVQQGTFATPWAGEWAADMAFGRGLIWQVNVGGDNGIYGIDPKDGSVKATITGTPWAGTSQRGLAYDPAADEFYIGGWNEGIVYRVAGPSHANPGETLGQCTPPDPAISGLAWNGSFGLLWEATNSDTDSIYLLDPATCEVQSVVPHPDGGGFGGAGLETDAMGNLWTVGQNSGNAYLVDSGLPAFSDVPWLSESPTSGTVAVDGSQAVTVSVDTTGMTPGVYRAIVVAQTNDPDHKTVQVPVVLVIPVYQQGVNAGGGRYVTGSGDVFAADQRFAPGGFGYVGASSTKSTKTTIAGTTDQALYGDLRTGMNAYRFTVPNGRYHVDLDFADFLAKKAGARVFTVSIEGKPVLFNLDVIATAGKNTALPTSFNVDVTDGELDIDFFGTKGDQPIVNGILVTELPPGSPE